MQMKLQRGFRRSHIACTSPKLATHDASKERVGADASWRYVELATGHDAMVTEPATLSPLILSLA